MIAFAAGTRVWIAGGVTDMRWKLRARHGLRMDFWRFLRRPANGGRLTSGHIMLCFQRMGQRHAARGFPGSTAFAPS